MHRNGTRSLPIKQLSWYRMQIHEGIVGLECDPTLIRGTYNPSIHNEVGDTHAHFLNAVPAL